MAQRLINILFGRTDTNDDIDKVVHLIDQALKEHDEASKKHQQRLEILKKELKRVEHTQGATSDGPKATPSSPSEG